MKGVIQKINRRLRRSNPDWNDIEVSLSLTTCDAILSSVTDDQLIEVANAIQESKNTTLTQFDLKIFPKKKWTAKGITALAESLQDHPHLEQIWINDHAIDNSLGILFLKTILAGKTSIKYIKYSTNFIDDATLATLGELLQQQNSLEFLAVDDNSTQRGPLQSSSWEVFFRGLAKHTNLRELSLYQLDLSQEVMALKQIPAAQLRRLSLVCMNFTPDDLQELSPLLTLFPNLTNLELSQHVMGLAEIQILLHHLPRLRLLQTLNLSYTQLNEEAVRYLTSQWKYLESPVDTIILDGINFHVPSICTLIQENQSLKELRMCSSQHSRQPDKSEYLKLFEILGDPKQCSIEYFNASMPAFSPVHSASINTAVETVLKNNPWICLQVPLGFLGSMSTLNYRNSINILRRSFLNLAIPILQLFIPAKKTDSPLEGGDAKVIFVILSMLDTQKYVGRLQIIPYTSDLISKFSYRRTLHKNLVAADEKKPAEPDMTQHQNKSFP